MITHDRLLQLVSYDPATGAFAYREPKGNFKPGDPAGCVDVLGYVILKLDGKSYKAHRLAWLYVHGHLPDDGVDIDHRNRQRADNRIENLREASRIENCQNQKLSRLNTSGIKGVSFNQKQRKWVAFITVSCRRKHLGSFAEIELAASARKTAETIYFGEFAAHAA